MTPTCGNCKFWNQENVVVEVAGFEDYGECDNPKVNADSNFAGISEGQCDYPNLFGKNFGCIHFTPKDTELITNTIAPFTLWVKHV